MILAHKIALDPTAKQANFLARACGVARFTWNWALAEWNRQYAAGKPNAMALKKQWNVIKREQFPWIYESPKGANQAPFLNLDKAFQSFFQGVKKRPTFHHKGQRDSFYVENDKLQVIRQKVFLPLIGSIRLKEMLRFEFEGKIMGAVVSRTADRWFISIQIELPFFELPRTSDNFIGVDLGLKTFATLSSGEQIEAPKPLKANFKRLRRAQRVLSRRVKGSKRRLKARQRVARIHKRVTDVRIDFLNKLTTRLVRENQVVAVEDLAVKNMVKNRSLARVISDAGWGEFRRQLEYKAQRYGTQILVVGRFYPSSKTCSGCGCVKETLLLSERSYSCEHCGLVMDRDLNAAVNILTAGLAGIARGPEGSGAACRTKPRRGEARTITGARASVLTQ
jgi:putative transposase